jgi:hypothetical protein
LTSQSPLFEIIKKKSISFVILSVPLGPGGEYSDVSEGYGLKRDDELPADDRPLNADPFIENGDLSPCADPEMFV